MIPQFEALTQEEIDQVILAPVWVTLLVAGADNKVDDREVKEAIEVALLEQEDQSRKLSEYYKLVTIKLEVNIKGYHVLLPDDPDKRNGIIEQKLEKLNIIFDKLDQDFAGLLYQSLRKLAHKVANASGGVFGFFKISNEESQYLSLPMLKVRGDAKSTD
jgi:hypothetical protein